MRDYTRRPMEQRWRLTTATALMGLSGGLGVEALGNTLGYRTVIGITSLAGVLLITNWLRQFPQDAPLSRAALVGFLSLAAASSVASTLGPNWLQRPALVASVLLTLAAALMPPENKDAFRVIAGVGFCGLGTVAASRGLQAMDAGQAAIGINGLAGGLGIGVAGVCMALQRSRAFLVVLLIAASVGACSAVFTLVTRPDLATSLVPVIAYGGMVIVTLFVFIAGLREAMPLAMIALGVTGVAASHSPFPQENWFFLDRSLMIMSSVAMILIAGALIFGNLAALASVIVLLGIGLCFESGLSLFEGEEARAFGYATAGVAYIGMMLIYFFNEERRESIRAWLAHLTHSPQ